jgi:hypothetical protein
MISVKVAPLFTEFTFRYGNTILNLEVPITDKLVFDGKLPVFSNRTSFDGDDDG